MKQNNEFQHLVLNALWVLILCAFGKQRQAVDAATNFQSSAISFGDVHGNQGEGAKEYRRKVTYGGNISA